MSVMKAAIRKKLASTDAPDPRTIARRPMPPQFIPTDNPANNPEERDEQLPTKTFKKR